MIFKRNKIYEIEKMVLTHTEPKQITLIKMNGTDLREYTKTMKFRRHPQKPEEWYRFSNTSIIKLTIKE